MQETNWENTVQMAYGKEAIMPMEYIVPSLCVVVFTNMVEPDIMEEHLVQLLALEEDRFIANFHQQAHKARKKSWHDWHIWKKIFAEGELVLLYDSQFTKHPGKFRQHWLGPYVVKEITNRGVVRLATLHGDTVPSMLTIVGSNLTGPTNYMFHVAVLGGIRAGQKKIAGKPVICVGVIRRSGSPRGLSRVLRSRLQV